MDSKFVRVVWFVFGLSLLQVTGLQISWAAILNIIVDEEDRDGDKINWRYVWR